MHKKLVVILGPTASGKSDLAVKLARRFSGEIISADSRQVYKGLNIGSGKVTLAEMKRIPHYLLDVANPKTRFTVAQYQKLALKVVAQIQARSHMPLLVGGTGFYIQSIVDGIVIPKVPPNNKLRKQLEKKSTEALFAILKKLDPARASGIDAKNPRRLIRAIEIVKATKKPIQKLENHARFDVLQIGINKTPETLKKLIAKRLQKRVKGIITEVKKLRKSGLSWKRLEEFGLEYRFVAQYLQHTLTQEEMVEKLQKEIQHYAKRQMTWFKRDKKIHWVKNQRQAEKLIKKFIQKKTPMPHI